METDSDREEEMMASEDEQKTPWSRLYIIVGVALVVEIAFFVWLTKAFE